jgi:hypothetical protein
MTYRLRNPNSGFRQTYEHEEYLSGPRMNRSISFSRELPSSSSRFGGRASYTRKASRRTKSKTYADSRSLWGDLSSHVAAAMRVSASLEKLSKDSIGRARAARIHRALGHILTTREKCICTDKSYLFSFFKQQ